MTKSSSLSKVDWLEAALQVTAEEGIRAVSVEPLAKRLGVTKGSFYWHFKNRNELLTQLVAHWENIENDYEQKLRHESDGTQDFLRNVLSILINDETNKRVFIALSRVNDNPTIQRSFQTAVERRLKLFRSAYASYGLTNTNLEKKAYATYFAYLGLIQSMLDGSLAALSNKQLNRLIRHIIDIAVDV